MTAQTDGYIVNTPFLNSVSLVFDFAIFIEASHFGEYITTT